MKYLVDVNALLALLAYRHSHHARARRWLHSLKEGDSLLLASLVEIGFLRVGLQSQHLADLQTGQKILASFLDGSPKVDFVADDSRASQLPRWVTTPAQIGDGHLLALAQAHGARLATFDSGIPGAFLIA